MLVEQALLVPVAQVLEPLATAPRTSGCLACFRRRAMILISTSLAFCRLGISSRSSSMSASSTSVSRSSRTASTWTFSWISSMVLAPSACQSSLPLPLGGLHATRTPGVSQR